MYRGILLLICLTLISHVYGEEKPGVTVTPMIGITDFGSDLNEDIHWSLGLGYQFRNPWAIEFVYANVDADDNRTGLDLDLTRWHVDGLYHLKQIGDYRPYLALGAGRAEYDFRPGVSDTETLYNLGIGVKYEFANNTSVRGELKTFKGNEIDDLDYAFSFGIQHVFAGGVSAKPVSVAPKDSDNDGVLDDSDRCPTTPQGVEVDQRGCALDSDRDGVADYRDTCPDTSKRGAKVDSQGCYVMLAEKISVELNVQFDNDSSTARSDHKMEVRRVFEFMQSYPLTKVTIEGHTDSNGSAEYNRDLSQRRASTIANILITEFGIDASRVSAKGYGEVKPITSNDTASGRQQNRRVVGIVETMIEKIQKSR